MSVGVKTRREAELMNRFSHKFIAVGLFRTGRKDDTIKESYFVYFTSYITS